MCDLRDKGWMCVCELRDEARDKREERNVRYERESCDKGSSEIGVREKRYIRRDEVCEAGLRSQIGEI